MYYTFIRDPVDRVLSDYYYFVSRRAPYVLRENTETPLTLREYLDVRDSVNLQTTRLINLAEVSSCDRASVSTLTTLRNLIDDAGGALVLLAPNQSVRRLLHLAGFTALIDIVRDERDALIRLRRLRSGS